MQLYDNLHFFGGPGGGGGGEVVLGEVPSCYMAACLS